MRTIFKDEILAPYQGSYDPQYAIQTTAGASKLTLLNPVAQPGTPLDAATLNNLFDFDNPAGAAGYRRATAFIAGGIEETYYDLLTGSRAAHRLTTFPNGNIEVTETVYDEAFILRQTKQTIVFDASGEIRDTITDL